MKNLVNNVKRYIVERQNLDEKENSVSVRYGFGFGILNAVLFTSIICPLLNKFFISDFFLSITMIAYLGIILWITNKVTKNKLNSLKEDFFNSNAYLSLSDDLYNRTIQKEIVSKFLKTENLEIKKLVCDLIEEFDKDDSDKKKAIDIFTDLIEKNEQLENAKNLEMKANVELNERLQYHVEYLTSLGIENDSKEKEINSSVKNIRTRL